MTTKIYLLSFVFSLLVVTQCAPAMNIGYKSSVVNKLRDAVFDQAMKKVMEIPVKPIDTETYNLKDIKLNGFTLNANDVKLELQQDWIKMTIFPFAVNGTMQARKIGKKQEWQEGKVQASQCTGNVGIMPYFVNGTTTWNVHNISFGLANILVMSELNKDQNFLKSFNSALMQHLQDIIQSSLTLLSSKFPESLKFPKRPLSLSGASTDTPNITTDFISLHLNGMVNYDKKPAADVGSPGKLPMFDMKLTSEFQAIVSDVMLNSALDGMNDNNYLESSFTGEKFTVKEFSKALPALGKKFGNNKKITLNCISNDVEKDPEVTSKKGGMKGIVHGQCDVLVGKEKVFTLKGSANLKVTAKLINKSSLQFTFVPTDVKITQVLNSNMKAINAGDATKGLNKIIKDLNVKRLLELPRIPIINLSNGNILYKDGYIEVGGDTKIDIVQ